jgi:F0F1-type ATP synthase membrane subunit b/b'
MNYQASPHLIRVFDFQILHMELNTVLFILGLVLIVMFFLNRLLFRPVLRTLDNRAHLMSSLRDKSTQYRQEIERLALTYQENLAQVRQEVARVRAETQKEIQQSVNQILSQARQEAQASAERALQDLERQIAQARSQLPVIGRALAEQATRRILGG